MRDFPLSADQDCISDDTFDYEQYARYRSLCLATGTLGLEKEMASLPPEDRLNSTIFFLSSLVKLPKAAIIHTSTSKKPVLDLLTCILLCHDNYYKKLYACYNVLHRFLPKIRHENIALASPNF